MHDPKKVVALFTIIWRCQINS